MSSTKAPAYTISASGNITVYINKKVYTACKDHVNYQKILEKVRSKKFGGLAKLFDVSSSINKRSRGGLVVKNGQVLYAGQPVHNYVVDRILQFMHDKLDFKPLVNFLRRLLKNPSPASVEQLYRFVEANNLPLTWDGYILCYKKVTGDYKDCHSQSIDNTVGKTVKMPREKVTYDPGLCNSGGLHVGGLNYVRGFYAVGNGHVMLVKVDPANVVSVPTDSASGKCRCCKYYVMAELTDLTKEVQQAEASTYGRSEPGEVDNNGWQQDYEDDDDDEDEVCENCGYPEDDCECDEDEHDILD
jgi:hypothetical protein